VTDIAIRVENLGKKYQIARQSSARRYQTLRDDLMSLPRALYAKIRGKTRDSEDFWALRDVSFDVKQGEVLGIIGRNGAGKSTLLKILARITDPTTGSADIFGRVGSLLEVGTGFHAELTGRENIYLSGAVLGMRRAEVRRKFDEIVDFAEVEKFIDTPAKHYSSGMYMRLAFAVAAHLEPEILIVDEVLAVGDAAFQRKCLGKMSEVAGEGRTVLFVSHNMAAVQQLCQTGIVLQAGQVSFWGNIINAISRYSQDIETIKTVNLAERLDRMGSQWLKFYSVRIFDKSGLEQKQVMSGQDIYIRFYYESTKVLQGVSVNIAFNVRTSQGYLLTNLNSYDVGKSAIDIYSRGYFQCAWPRFNLRSGYYDCNIFCSVNDEIVDWMQSAFTIQVEDGDFFNTGSLINRDQGDFLAQYDWSGHRTEK
jgi:lipopolysaccharide transport system ATP-binding protein